MATAFLFCSASALADPASPSPSFFEPAPPTKQVIGTSYEPTGSNSPLWFTLTGGIVTELFYPTVDQPQLGELQFVVTDGKGFFSMQKRDTVSRVNYRDEGLVVEVTGRDKSQRYTYKQEIFTDIASPVLRIRTTFLWLAPDLRVFIVFKPTIQGASDGNFGEAGGRGLFASATTPAGKEPVYTALVSSVPWAGASARYEDGSWNFREMGALESWESYQEPRLAQVTQVAGPGNIVLTGELQKSGNNSFSFELALGFGETQAAAITYADAALAVPFETGRELYETGWNDYLEDLSSGPDKPFFIRKSTFARRSAQLIKIHEDKRHHGAIAPALSGLVNSLNPTQEGALSYFRGIRVRDAYHAAMGLLAAGDRRTPLDVFRYLMSRQNDDGSWSPSWNLGDPGPGRKRGIQIAMDEVALPILLAGQLQRRGVIRLRTAELEMIRKAAAFILSHGPTTDLDRWETIGGYIPSTLAVEIAALRVASALTQDPLPATVGDKWQSRLERWTLEADGPLGKNYYLRAGTGEIQSEATHEEKPASTMGAGPLLASELVDGGFLDLVRYGVRDAADPRVLSTLKVYESPAAGVAGGLHYRRFVLDPFGPDSRGGFWPLLAGERGNYAVLAKDLERARAELHALETAATENGLLPEQAQAGLEVACPYVWAHAEDILLHRSIEEGSVFDQPTGY